MEPVDDRRSVTEIFYASLRAVDPNEAVSRYADKIRSTYKNGDFNRLIVIGLGKASCRMAKALEDRMTDLIVKGIVITKYGHCGQTGPDKIKVLEAGHPVPDMNGFINTRGIIKLLQNADEKTLVICLISGGGSALLVAPHKGTSLDEKQKVTQLLLKGGANIDELNTVRKHISAVKGGRLAEIAYPARILSLILSDVIGDRLDVIASGPTVPDTTTFRDAVRVLEKYHLMEKTPEGVLKILQKGTNGLIPETPKEGNKLFGNVENIIIGSNKIALRAAKEEAEEMGLHAEITSSELMGEAREAGKWLAQKAMEIKDSKGSRPVCLISGGETTVTVKGDGIGGRNMELALAFALEIKDIEGITLLSAGTDGTDGPTDAAGAIVDGETVKKARAIGLDPVKYLKNNDSYTFFKNIRELFVTGPTGTNVMDIQIVLIV